jgi:hypothetical protein
MNDREHDDDGVEELSDDVIIAQETGAHAPAARAQVATDHPTVVISDVPGAPHKLPTVPPMRRAERTEKTVVIRDRKSLDRLRKEASRRPSRSRSRRPSRSRTITLIGVAVLASLAAGTLLAALANSTGSDATPVTSATLETQEPTALPSASGAAPAVVDLEDLPVVKQKKKRKPADD